MLLIHPTREASVTEYPRNGLYFLFLPVFNIMILDKPCFERTGSGTRGVNWRLGWLVDGVSANCRILSAGQVSCQNG